MPERRFPETFLEIGKDDDHSYNSLRTTRLPDGRLKIDVERWGIVEHGISLSVHTGKVIELLLTGDYGMVEKETWEKVSDSHIVENKAEDKALWIEFSGHVPVEFGQIDIQLKVRKLPDQRKQAIRICLNS